MEQAFMEENVEFINSTMKSSLVTLINYNEGYQIESKINVIYQKIAFDLEKFNTFSITIGVGNPTASLNGVNTSIKQAIEAVKCRLKYGVNRIIYYKKIRFKCVAMDQIITDKDRRALGMQLKHLILKP